MSLSAFEVQSQQNTFAIYLFAGPIDARTLAHEQEEWKQLPLSSVPLISDADIISYDFSNHAMRIGSEALKRLPKPPVTGTPFVVVVNGERIYQGAFYTSASSIPYSQPVIVVDSPTPAQAQRSDLLLIQRAYPAQMARGEDLRSDERIKSALSKLKKLASLLSAPVYRSYRATRVNTRASQVSPAAS